MLQERDFYDEVETKKPATLNCEFCHHVDTYEVRWVVRTKKKALQGPVDDSDRVRFARAQSYMTRVDTYLQCKNPRCRKRFTISGLQSVAFI